jgi:Fanconi anemia group M protein
MAPFVEHSLLKPDTMEQRLYQTSLARRALSGNTLVVMPTGLGKTNVACLMAAELLGRDKGGKILMLAPTKPLAQQHLATFKSFLKLDDDAFALLTGEVSEKKRRNLWLDSRVITATPQTIESELGKGLDLTDVMLLIVDESHHTVRNYSYVEVARKYMDEGKKPLILGLTASPSTDKIKEVCRNLSIQNVEVRSETDPDVAPYVQKRDTERIFVELPDSFEEIRTLLKSYSDEAFNKLKEMNVVFSNSVRKRDIIKLQQNLIKNKIYGGILYATALLKAQHALEMLETQGIHSLHSYFEKMKQQKTKTVAMMFKDERVSKAVSLTSLLYAEGIDHPKMGALKELVAAELIRNPSLKMIVFAHYREASKRIAAELNKIPGASAVRFVGQASKEGDIGLNQEQQAEIIRQFREDKYNILVCTSVGEEGLDIPSVDLVIFYEPVASEIRKIQREGRTGRKRAGKVAVLITKETRDESYYYAARYKEKKMRKILEGMQPKITKTPGQTKMSEW